ncbi:Digeranylgeranylglyceryl phosphate synthase [Termitomyces sp. T112]|nr:Digeranylgeranylglyceryl phosphate synthase [Termitomyces sp. T112]
MRLAGHIYTLILFSWSDYKTIFLPITAFACATAPVQSLSNLIQGCIWIWIHLILCNVSNQARAKEEDEINRPWRPLPSGRITIGQAFTLRWVMVVFCIVWSAAYGAEMILVTLGLVATTLFHDDAGFSNHPVGKNLCNVGGYTTIEVGATRIMANQGSLDSISIQAILLSALVIFTTIQAQDFPDVEGDSAIKRVTFPIYAPEFSRLFTLTVISLWSLLLCWLWDIECFIAVPYVSLGIYVGSRYYFLRTQTADRYSYIIFNAWLMFSHLLSFQARMDIAHSLDVCQIFRFILLG